MQNWPFGGHRSLFWCHIFACGGNLGWLGGGGGGGLHGVVAKHEVLSITEPLFCTKIRGGMGGGVSTPFWGYF